MIGIKRTVRDRGKINLAEPTQVRLWVKGLGASKQEIERAIEKVGNSAAAVRKELRRAIRPRYASETAEKASSRLLVFVRKIPATALEEWVAASGELKRKLVT